MRGIESELTLHFGQERPFRSPKLAVLRKGSFVIAARAPSQLKPLTPEQLEKSKLLAPGTRIVAVDAMRLRTGRRAAYGFGLSAVLADGSSLLIVPPAAPKSVRPPRDVADWEVFTPHERYLRVGPGLRWSYLASRAGTEA